VHRAADGSCQVSFRARVTFGDEVTYKSAAHGEGSGEILNLILQADSGVYYMIKRAEGYLQSGIYPDEISLLSRKEK